MVTTCARSCGGSAQLGCHGAAAAVRVCRDPQPPCELLLKTLLQMLTGRGWRRLRTGRGSLCR